MIKIMQLVWLLVDLARFRIKTFFGYEEPAEKLKPHPDGQRKSGFGTGLCWEGEEHVIKK